MPGLLPSDVRARNCSGVFAALVAVFAISSLGAQVQAGRIVGTVFDPNKAVAPNAAVVVTQTETNQSTTVTTNDEGNFVVTPLNPGLYNVRVTLAGFQTTQVNNVEVQVGQSSRVDVELKLGETSVRVEVSSAAPLLDTESGTLGHVVTNTQIVNLPLNGRSFYELARLMPGAAALPGGGNLLRIRPNFESGTAISGVRGSQTSFLLDGVDTTDHHQGGTLVQTSIDALQEFKVTQSEYAAEYSHAGGTLNATTKSGANEFHGGVFEFLRNDKLDARNFFLPQREVLKRNQFGGDIGGPLSIPRLYSGKDRMFFFLSYEGMRERQGLVFNSIVPTPAMKSGDFSAPGLNALYDPLTTVNNARMPFAGNLIPLNRQSAQALFFNKYIPNPNTPAGTAAFAPSRALNTDQFTIRVDRRIRDNHGFFARWSWHNYEQNEPSAFPALGIAPLTTRGQNVVGSLTSTLRPNVIHEFRFSYLPITIDLVAFLQGTDFYKQAGITGFEDTGHRPGVAGSFPDFAWSGYASMSGSTFDQRPKTQDLKVYEWTDSLTWVKGRHIFKFGGKIRYWIPLFTDSGTYEGLWSFNGSNTQNPARTAGAGDAFADYMLGLPRSVARGYPADWFGGYATYWHFYGQDDVKLTDRLTLNVGLRYEYSPWLKGYRGQVGGFDGKSPRPIIIASDSDQIDLGAQFSGPASYAVFKDLIQTSRQAGLPLTVTYPDKNQWAPRLGLAWRPFGNKTVLRGGYGIFYETESSGNRVNHNMIPFRLDETVFNSSAVPNRTMADFFLGRSIGSAGTTPGLGPGPVHMRMGYDQHWSFGIQQELRRNVALEVDYVGNKGSFLAGGQAINDPPAGPGDIQSRRPYPLFGGIGYTAQNVSSTYHALQSKFEKRYSAGLWYLVSYTYSKSLLRQNTPVAGGDYAWEKALSGFDIPHNLAASAGYELPIGKGKRFLANSNRIAEGVLGGWQLQTIVSLRSGRPFTPTISRDVSNTGLGGQRPNRIRSGALDHRTLDKWFDKSAFDVPVNFTYGNSGANILCEDRFKDIDFSIFKQFRVTEQGRLQFRAEFFNLTNTSSFNAPGTNIDTASGGRVLSTFSTPRQIQFALKYNF